MIIKRPAEQRGHANYGWLDTWHSFSFADYHDPEQMGWGPLRVINDDTVAPTRGFGTHGHRDMEIISLVLAGELAHKDSMGHGTTIRPGEVQRMSAGKGVMHSEFNPLADAPTRFLQIWIQPSVRGGAPSYEQKTVSTDAGTRQWLASPDGAGDSVRIQQDARLSRLNQAAGQSTTLTLAPGRLGYLHLIDGAGTLSAGDAPRCRLTAGDGAKIAGETTLVFSSESATGTASDWLFFDLPETSE